MNPDIKKRWLEALRSGEYEQGTARLKTAETYCCLGVLCDLHRAELGEEWGSTPLSRFDARAGIPSGETRVWADQCLWSVYYKGERSSLTILNDEVGLTFNQIADLIEEQL